MRRFFCCFVLFPLLLLAVACSEKPQTASQGLGVWLGDQPGEGFKRAIEARDFSFPQDHFDHPGYRNEWWYVTGNLQDMSGNEFGYQLTFFRIGISPAGQARERESAWAAETVWMAHIALSDLGAARHYHDQRFARGAAGLAGVKAAPFTVWLEDWNITGASDGSFPWELTAANADFSLQLNLSPLKPIVLQGENGLSRKSSGQGNASYYYSLTRLQTAGEILVAGNRYEVSGLSWLDREWSTSVLASHQVGWDWFSLQLDDGSDVMYYQLRNQQGAADDFSAGKWVKVDGAAQAIRKHEISLQPIRYWKSSSGRRYPVEWRLELPGKHISWRIEAALDNQEMRTVVDYWEGVVRVYDALSKKQIGKGYLEMTGY